MAILTRRGFGLGALAAPGLVTLTAGSGLADGHAAKPAAPAMFDAPLGDYRITAIFDGMAPLQRDFFFGVDAEKIATVLDGAGYTSDALPAPVNTFLLQSADRTILIDAGMGAIDIFGPGFGRLTDGLAAAGVAAADVDTIILTHGHPDHIGGLMGAEGAVFPNAEVFLLEAEHAFWTDDAVLAAVPEASRGMFDFARMALGAYGSRLNIVSSETEIAPGVMIEAAPGHTPGHGVVMIDGGARSLLMVADTLHNVHLHTALPEIGFGFDTDTALAAQTRRRIFDRASADGLLIAATHAHFPGFGRIVKDGEAYRYVGASWV